MIEIPKKNIKYPNSTFELAKIKIPVNSSLKELEECDIDKVINAEDIQYQERNESCCFRIHGTITPIMNNCLVEPDIIDSIQEIVNQPIYSAYTLQDLTLENNGWYKYYNPKDICTEIDIFPNPELFNMCNEDLWEFKLGYNNSCEDLLISGSSLYDDGILVYNEENIDYVGIPFNKVTSIFKHALIVGDIIKIKPLDVNVEVKRIVDDYNFLIDEFYSGITSFNRVYKNIESKYYYRKLKFISDVTINFSGFQKTLYNEQVLNYTLEDLDLCQYVDCFGKPIDRVYLVAIKKENNYWSDLQLGIETYYENDDFNIKKNINSLGFVTIDDEEIFCDIVEYNDLEQVEKPIAESYIKFNSIIRDSVGMTEHYYYKSCCEIKFRNYSSYLEKGEIDDTNTPDYAKLINGSYYWRDLLPYGIPDISDDYVDRPFLNGCHYIYENCIFCLERQNNDCNFDYSTYPEYTFELFTPDCTKEIDEVEIDDLC